MVNIEEWDRNETVRIENTYTMDDGSLYDPDTIELRIYNSTGALDNIVTLAAGEIINVSLGIFYYDFSLSDSAALGWWNTEWTAVMVGTLQTDVTKGQFYVRDPQEKLYCTVAQAYNQCGMESEVASANETIDYIRNSMGWIDAYFGKSFGYSNSAVQWFDTNQPDRNNVVDTIFLRYTPVRSVTSVEEYDTNNDLAVTHASNEYWLDEDTGIITLNTKEFAHQKHRVKVVYTYGFDQVPRNITALCAVLSGQSILLKFAGASYDDVTSWSAASLSVSVGEPYVNATRVYELLQRRKDKLLGDVGRLRESIHIV